jgi:hypothetical protein
LAASGSGIELCQAGLPGANRFRRLAFPTCLE